MQDGNGLLTQVGPKYVTMGSMFRLKKMQGMRDQQVKSKTGHDMMKNNVALICSMMKGDET